MTHQGSVGRGFRETELRILDPDGRDLPTGQLGEIYLRSPMYEGYEYLGGAPPLRGTDDGFHTAGDLGYLDDEGYLYLVDRRVDMIITGGANVFPAEVECALIDHPAIADVVVIGLRDPEWGRRVHAIVQPADPARRPPPTTCGPTRRAGWRRTRSRRPSRSSTPSPAARPPRSAGAPSSRPAGADRPHPISAVSSGSDVDAHQAAEVAAHDLRQVVLGQPRRQVVEVASTARPGPPGAGSRSRTARGRRRSRSMSLSRSSSWNGLT